MCNLGEEGVMVHAHDIEDCRDWIGRVSQIVGEKFMVVRLTSFRGEFRVLESAWQDPRNGPECGLEAGDGRDMGYKKGFILSQNRRH